MTDPNLSPFPTAAAWRWLRWVRSLPPLEQLEQVQIASPAQQHAYDVFEALVRIHDAPASRHLGAPRILQRDHSGPGYHRNPCGSYRHRGWIPQDLDDEAILTAWEAIHGRPVPLDHLQRPVIYLAELQTVLRHLGRLGPEQPVEVQP